MQPEAATVSITRHLDLRPSFFGQPERKAPRLWATAGFYVRPCLEGEGEGMFDCRRRQGGASSICDPRTPSRAGRSGRLCILLGAPPEPPGFMIPSRPDLEGGDRGGFSGHTGAVSQDICPTVGTPGRIVLSPVRA